MCSLPFMKPGKKMTAAPFLGRTSKLSRRKKVLPPEATSFRYMSTWLGLGLGVG